MTKEAAIALARVLAQEMGLKEVALGPLDLALPLGLHKEERQARVDLEREIPVCMGDF